MLKNDILQRHRNQQILTKSKVSCEVQSSMKTAPTLNMRSLIHLCWTQALFAQLITKKLLVEG